MGNDDCNREAIEDDKSMGATDDDNWELRYRE